MAIVALIVLFHAGRRYCNVRVREETNLVALDPGDEPDFDGVMMTLVHPMVLRSRS